MAKKPDPTEVTVTYDLFDLPTAFHKAGLAGLVLLVESLKARKVLTADDARYAVTATTAIVTFTESLLQRLMDDLYDARVVEVAVRTKWAGAEVKREEMVEEEVDGKKSRTKRFIYDQVQPKGSYFDNVFDGDKEVWRKLWRDMLWAIPRGRPTTREPYNQRAAGQPCKEGPNGWDDLLKVQKARAKGQVHTAEVSSALLLGAQAVNAEGVPFEGRAEHNLLLHFWPLTVLLYVPQSVDREGATEFVGYTVAVPEVADLEEFVVDYPKVLAGLSKDVRGFRPAGAVIDLPAAGALEALAAITAAKFETGELRFSVGGVDYLHLVKQGNNVKTMAAGRVAADRRLMAAYRELVPTVGQPPPYRNPLFRRGLLVALLDRREWFQPLDRTLAAFDSQVFIRQPRKAGSEEKGPPQFANDAARKFRQLAAVHAASLTRYSKMSEPERTKHPRPTPSLADIVNRVVRNYLLARAEDKSGIKVGGFTKPGGDGKDVTDWAKVPAEFNEAKRKLAESLFLEFRSRKGQAFADHFAATMFRVTQRVNKAGRQELAAALTAGGKLDDLKTLTLLSLSANS